MLYDVSLQAIRTYARHRYPPSTTGGHVKEAEEESASNEISVLIDLLMNLVSKDLMDISCNVFVECCLFVVVFCVCVLFLHIMVTIISLACLSIAVITPIAA